jgi:amino acid transporter
MTTVPTEPQTAETPQGFSLLQAIAIGVNTTSPAYSLAAILAPMALLVGYSTPIVLVVSFIPMALTSLAFMYLGRRDPDCGTTFSWVSRAIGPRPGFIAGWVIAAAGILVLGSLAETAITYGFLTFGLDSLAGNRALVVGCAAVLILLMTGLAIVGSESSVRLQTILTFVQIGILLAFGIGAALLASRTYFPSFDSAWLNPFSSGLGSLVSAMLLGVFAFWGWEAATNLSEECRKPSDAGKAGVISTIVLLTTYLLVAVFVVIYLGKTNFNAVGESGLVLVDMAGVVFGPLAFLVLLAVFLSALASTQSTMVPGSRAVLSMARRGALPARLGLTHPKFKSPWVSLALLGGIAACWYLLVSSLSENAMVDTLSSLGILVAFYYSLTGIACIVYYRRHVTASVRGFLMVGLGPLIGSVGLAFMLVIGIRSVSNPADSASGSAWLGLAPPLTIAAVILVLGLIVLVVRMLRHPSFFARRRERADITQSPFPLGHDISIAPGGVLIDCNAMPHEVIRRIGESEGLVTATRPVTLVFGVHPSGLSGEEMTEAREALAEEGNLVFTAVESHLRAIGVRDSVRLFEEADSEQSVHRAQNLVDPSVTV